MVRTKNYAAHSRDIPTTNMKRACLCLNRSLSTVPLFNKYGHFPPLNEGKRFALLMNHYRRLVWTPATDSAMGRDC